MTIVVTGATGQLGSLVVEASSIATCRPGRSWRPALSDRLRRPRLPAPGVRGRRDGAADLGHRGRPTPRPASARHRRRQGGRRRADRLHQRRQRRPHDHAAGSAQVIAGQKLDAEKVTVHGALKTVSHGKKWELLASEFGNISIDLSEIEGRPWVDWNPDDLVEVAAPGWPTTRSLTAQRISKWEGSLNEIRRTFEDELT
jgi:hypothetical protein